MYNSYLQNSTIREEKNAFIVKRQGSKEISRSELVRNISGGIFRLSFEKMCINAFPCIWSKREVEGLSSSSSKVSWKETAFLLLLSLVKGNGIVQRRVFPTTDIFVLSISPEKLRQEAILVDMFRNLSWGNRTSLIPPHILCKVDFSFSGVSKACLSSVCMRIGKDNWGRVFGKLFTFAKCLIRERSKHRYWTRFPVSFRGKAHSSAAFLLRWIIRIRGRH